MTCTNGIFFGGVEVGDAIVIHAVMTIGLCLRYLGDEGCQAAITVAKGAQPWVTFHEIPEQ